MSVQNLAELIAKVESDNDPFAIRFEPAHVPEHQFVDKMMQIVNCSEPTANVLCSCSYGLYQIMGDNLIWLGLELSPLKFCTIPELQTQFFNEFLAKNGIVYTLDEVINDVHARLHFARVYNGNAEMYAARMMECAK